MHNLRRIINKHNNILNLAKLAAGTILLDNISSHREYIIKKKKKKKRQVAAWVNMQVKTITQTLCVCVRCVRCAMKGDKWQ